MLYIFKLFSVLLVELLMGTQVSYLVKAEQCMVFILPGR